MSNWPQYTQIALTIIGLLLYANLHGKPRDPWNFWSGLGSSIIAYIILYYGGFFAPIGWTP